MRYIGRTHGISVAWLHETFKKDELTLAYELSARMCADIFTKGFTDADKWRLACSLICIIDQQNSVNLLNKQRTLSRTLTACSSPRLAKAREKRKKMRAPLVMRPREPQVAAPAVMRLLGPM